jgi:hypothetical protein
MLNHPESRVPCEMAHVRGSAGGKVVDRENIPAAIEKAIAEVRSEKSPASRDYRAQLAALSLPLPSGCLRFIVIRYSLIGSKLVDTLNFIVA